MRGTLEKVEIREPLVIESQGQQILGVLHRPTICDYSPVVVILHGFASNKLGSNRCYVALAENFAKHGIAVLRFDFRGCGDSEGTLSELSLQDLVSDALRALEIIDTIQGIDSSRMALFGASLGGAIAILAAAQCQRVKTMALWAPVASGELWYHDFLKRHPEHLHTDPSQTLANYQGVHVNAAFRNEFRQMFAYKTIQQLKGIPILMMHGEKDDIVSIHHLEAFQQACSAADSVRFVKYPDCEHSLGLSSQFPAVIAETIQWFQRYL